MCFKTLNSCFVTCRGRAKIDESAEASAVILKILLLRASVIISVPLKHRCTPAALIFCLSIFYLKHIYRVVIQLKATFTIVPLKK